MGENKHGTPPRRKIGSAAGAFHTADGYAFRR